MAITRRQLVQRSAAGAAALALGAAPAAADPLGRRAARALREAVRGPVLLPGASGYDAARVVFNTRFDALRPPAVVRAAGPGDVRAVVRWANEFDVPLVLRSGAHAYNGASTSERAVVLDVGGLDGFAFADGKATAGPGTRLIDLYTRLAARGATVPAGSCPTVGLGGLVTGGGMGLAGRRLGLTLDRVTAFQVVTADGRLRRVDARSGAELFWALRGGGGSFAAVTAVTLRVARVGPASWFRVTYPAASREEALAAWDDLAPGAPADLTAILTLTATGATAFGQSFGSERALRRIVAPLARVPGAGLTAGTAGYLDLQRRWAGGDGGGRSTFDASSIYVGRRLPPAGRRAFLAAADAGATLICDAYGGAIGEQDRRDTAFPHRDVRFSVQVLSYADAATARDRVRRARALIASYGTGGAYANYADLRLRNFRRAYYGGNAARLARIKADVDPENRFRPVQGIRPALPVQRQAAR